MNELEQFREETREWIETSCPESLRSSTGQRSGTTMGGRRFPVFAEPAEDSHLWLSRAVERGYCAPTWPREYGGAGLERAQAAVLREEMLRLGAPPPVVSMGLLMFGPTLLEFGTEEQKQQHLPPIARGEISWCQGYSEPGAGSDLASLQTRCEDRGDHYSITGQKIWTSGADVADWMFCLVRSDPGAPKHEGISLILIDMNQPGVRVSPIKLISGSSPFCQTFFEEVRAEKNALVGPLHGGWTVAKRLLQYERQGISSSGFMGPTRGTDAPPELAKRYCGTSDGKVADPIIRDRLARMEMDQHCFNSTVRRTADEARAGNDVGTASSIFKYKASEDAKKRGELMVAILGTQGLGWEGDGYEPFEIDQTRTWLRSKGNSIEGGTSEVQLNIIAKRVLGLPD
ncbi:acyl-CoA dehydrogenase family protein [Myxococcota bacterium]|nr:acyl-CoA dehydrogenase family protein [Myxococcota bacterium]